MLWETSGQARRLQLVDRSDTCPSLGHNDSFKVCSKPERASFHFAVPGFAVGVHSRRGLLLLSGVLSDDVLEIQVQSQGD